MVKCPGQPQDTPRHLVLMSTETAGPERHLQKRVWGSVPVFPAQKGALAHGEEPRCFRHAMSYLPAWRTPEMLKRPKSVITTFPLS